jgi:hypothetical protein
MAKKSRKNFDIHHPDMVKMVFILVSLAIVAFLVLVVKYTSFKSEPKAAPPKTLPKNIGQKPKALASVVLNTLIKRACIKKFNQNSYYTVGELDVFGYPNPDITYQNSGDCKNGVTYYKGMVSVGQFYTGWKKYWYGLWYDTAVSCCSTSSDFKKKSDKYCSNVQLYDSKAQPIGTRDMKCKLNCGDTEDSEYNVAAYNYIPTKDGLNIQTTKVSCEYAKMDRGVYKVVSGGCCGKNSY